MLVHDGKLVEIVFRLRAKFCIFVKICRFMFLFFCYYCKM